MNLAVELSFPARAERTIAADHAAPVYGAISRLIPEVHSSSDFGIHPIGGRIVGPRLLKLMPWSRLALRCPADRIPTLLPLSGASLDIGGAVVRIGTPEVSSLVPATALRSRLVTIKLKERVTPDRFREAVRRQLSSLSVSNRVEIILPQRNHRETGALEPIQRTFRIHGREIIGFEVVLEGLTADESLTVQERGVGGRRKLGCGLFVPVRATDMTANGRSQHDEPTE